MHAPDGSCRKPAGARAPVTGGTGGHRARYQRPTAGVAAARPQADPAVGGGACPPAGIGAAPMGGARRRRDAAGRRAGRADTPPPAAEGWRARGRGLPARARAMATARPMAARRALRGRRRAEWVGNGTTGRGRKPRRGRALDAGPRERALLLPYGSARDRRDRPGGVPNAADWPIFAQKPFLLRKRSASCASNYSQKIGFCASPKRKLGGGPTTLLGGAFPSPVAADRRPERLQFALDKVTFTVI